MTTEALSGEMSKVGKSGRNYLFGFGWSCRYNLEQIYGPGLQKASEEVDQFKVAANTLLAALQAREVNQIPDDFSPKQLYALLDDLGEEAVTELWTAAKHSLGFTHRLLGVSDEDLERLAAKARVIDANPDQPTGTNS